jgi:hypothetical protein
MVRPAALLVLLSTAACASLGPLSALVRPPRFSEANDQSAEIRLSPPSGSSALGGATVRLWTKVTNPNPFGFTLSTLAGTLYLEESRAATTDFPLGLPLGAGAESVIPIDFAISFADLPNLAGVIRQAINQQPVDYRFEGTVAVDAGRFGTPVLGPMTFLRGTLSASGRREGRLNQPAGLASWRGGS